MTEFQHIDFQTYTAVQEAITVLTEVDKLPYTVSKMGQGLGAAYAARVRAHAAVVGSGLEWQERTLARRPHTRLVMIEDEVDAIAVGHATYEWEDILSNINICRTARVYAWFFPLGAKAARERPGLTMYANNRPNK